MGKITVIFCFLCTVVTMLYSQETFVDSRLDAVYSDEYINDLMDNNPQQLKYKNWYLDNSYEFMQLDSEKSSQMPSLKHFDPVNKILGEDVQEVNQEDFNIYMYSFDRKYDKDTYYQIGNNGMVILIYSHKRLAKNFNTYIDEN